MAGQETLQDRAIRHAAMLVRYEEGEARRILAIIDREMLPDLLDVFRRRMGRIDERGFDLGPMTTKRLAALYTAMDEIANAGNSLMFQETKRGLLTLAQQEASFQAKSIVDALPASFDFTPSVPQPAALRNIVTNNPFEGRVLREWYGRQGANLRHGLRREIRNGLTQGETISQMTKRVEGLLAENGQTKQGARAIVRTATNQVANNAAYESIAANPDVYKGWRFLATLDQKTTLECAGLDGTTYALDDTDKLPPRHWGCRSRVVGELKSYKDLGIDVEDTPPLSRASATGPVAGDTTYQGWLEKMNANPDTKHFVDDALGPKRAELWRKGVDVKRFTGPTGETLTIDQVARREGISLGKKPPKQPTAPKRPGKSGIRLAEDSIRGDRLETGILFDKHGKEISRRTGGESHVNYSKAQRRELKGNILTHNHPDGSSLSTDDIRIGAAGGVREMRSVGFLTDGRAVTHSASFKPFDPMTGKPTGPGKTGWKRFQEKADRDIGAARNRAIDRAAKRVRTGRMTEVDAALRVMHETWQDVRKEGWLDYLRQFG